MLAGIWTDYFSEKQNVFEIFFFSNIISASKETRNDRQSFIIRQIRADESPFYCEFNIGKD